MRDDNDRMAKGKQAVTDQPDRPRDDLLSPRKQCPKCLWWSNDPQHERNCRNIDARANAMLATMCSPAFGETPAPDAMREALDKLVEIAIFAENNAACGGDKQTWAAHARKVREAVGAISVAISASVPSPDGAEPECEPFRIESTYDAEGFIMSTRFVPVPSGAGAAEPVLYREETKPCPICHSFPPICPGHASPPVRGDRELLAETIHKARYKPDREPTPFSREYTDGRAYCFRIADAIIAAGLVVPVQPGTGERRLDDEELAQQVRAVAFEECLEIIQELDSGRGNERTIIDRLRDLRQAPHSSSEGGR